MATPPGYTIAAAQAGNVEVGFTAPPLSHPQINYSVKFCLSVMVNFLHLSGGVERHLGNGAMFRHTLPHDYQSSRVLHVDMSIQ